MKTVTLISRLLLALIFLVFGLNGFFNFIPQPPPPPGFAGQFFGVMMGSHYLVLVFALQIVAGVLFLIGRFVPLALVLIGPVIVNILMYHTLMAPGGIALGLVAAILWFVVAYWHRSAFAGIFQP